MIKINLLPDRLKKKKRRLVFNLPSLPRETVIALVGSIVVLLILLHLFLLGVLIIEKARLSALNRSWKKVEPFKTQVDAVKGEISGLESKTKSFAAVTNDNKRILWAKKMNQLSDFLPPGVWFTKFYLANQKLIIEGSAISQKGDEMVKVGKFTSALKNEISFSKDFQDIELTSINRKLIKSVEVADFIITARLKD